MRLATFLLLCSCATISTAGMSEPCKAAYNACLNGCPDAARSGNPNPPPSAIPMTIKPEVASCTDDCNRQARSCK